MPHVSHDSNIIIMKHFTAVFFREGKTNMLAQECIYTLNPIKAEKFTSSILAKIGRNYNDSHKVHFLVK